MIIHHENSKCSGNNHIPIYYLGELVGAFDKTLENENTYGMLDICPEVPGNKFSNLGNFVPPRYPPVLLLF